MPLPIMLAHKLAMKLTEVRKKKVLPYLGPDGKTQVTVEYRDGKFTTEEAKRQIIDKVVRPVVGDLLDKKTKIMVNGTGTFLVSGPQADTGLTGRKIIVDTYGGWAVHGGVAAEGVMKLCEYTARPVAIVRAMGASRSLTL